MQLRLNHASKEISAYSENAHLNKGTVLCSAGDTPACFYAIKSGIVKAYDYGYEGREYVHCLFSKNSVLLADFSLLQRPTIMSYEAVTDLVAQKIYPYKKEMSATISQEDYMAILLQAIETNIGVVDYMRKQIMKTPEERLLDLLELYAMQFGVVRCGGRMIAERISVAKIASLIGVSEMTASRAMKTLRDNGVVKHICGFYWLTS